MIDLNLRPETRQLKQFGYVAVLAFGLLGGVVTWKGGLFGLSFGDAAPGIAYAMWAVGLLSGLLSLTYPTANRPLFLTLSLLAFPIGFVLSHAIMAFLFFGLLTPLALIFRMIGRDALERKFEPQRRSYWTDLPETNEPSDYFRQF